MDRLLEVPCYATLPLFNAFVVSFENSPSTAFSQEEAVEAKFRWKRG
jgi:hypothetical protein